MNNKKDDFLQKEYLKNENIQIAIRLFFTIAAVASIYFYKEANPEAIKYSYLYILIPPAFVISFNILYYMVIQRFPYKWQIERILFSVCIDIGLTVYMMYLVNDFAAYYAGVLLWFSVAYGMRYSKKVAYTAYFMVLGSWMVLMVTSDFWIEHRNVAIGWLLAFIVLPLYYFRLVAKLRASLEDLHHYAEESRYLALHDQLTGARNRVQFNEDLENYMKAYREKNEKFALFFIDLDSFKDVNDLYGHDTGDDVLIEAYNRIHNVMKNTYRLGGDEFVAIMGYERDSELKKWAQNLMFVLTRPCKKHEVTLSASIGIARFPDDAKTEYDIKKRADLAMYAAKQAGKNRFYCYSEVA